MVWVRIPGNYLEMSHSNPTIWWKDVEGFVLLGIDERIEGALRFTIYLKI